MKTEQTDSDIWGRSHISLVKGGYEGVVVAIHDSVKQEEYDYLTDQIEVSMYSVLIFFDSLSPVKLSSLTFFHWTMTKGDGEESLFLPRFVVWIMT